jgi:TM2 domain-containing membrane protein YozV
MTCAVHTDQPASAYCRTCGKALCQSCQRDVRGVVYCQDCLAARLEGTVPPAAANAPAAVYATPSSNASPGLAAVLGFIPGVGAFYNGQFAKGFVHVFIFAILTHLANRSDWFGWTVAAWLFYMVFDAYSTAKARVLGQPLPDPIGINNLLANFGLGSNTTPPLATMGTMGAAGMNPAASSVPPPSGTAGPVGFAPADQAAAQAPFVPTAAQGESCGANPGGLPLGAIILIGLGVIFLLDNLGVLSFRWTAEFWPIILIVIGIWLAFRRFSGTQTGGPR